MTQQQLLLRYEPKLHYVALTKAAALASAQEHRPTPCSVPRAQV